MKISSTFIRPLPEQITEIELPGGACLPPLLVVDDPLLQEIIEPNQPVDEVLAKLGVQGSANQPEQMSQKSIKT